MKNIPFIIAGLIAAFILLGSCNAGPQPGSARNGGDLAEGEQAAPPPGGHGTQPVNKCAAVLAQAQAAGDDLTGDTDLYYRHLEVCHTDPPTAPTTTTPPAPTTTERPPPATDLAATTTADQSDLV